MSGPRLGVAGLSVRRGGRVIFEGVSLEVAAGEIVGVVGPNGCGKSTLLQAIAGVLEPRAGHVRIEGHGVWGSRRSRQAARAQLGYVPEGADAPGFLTGGELWSLCRGARGGELSPSVREGLGLADLEALRLETMSLGQRRRACLGGAFVGPPALLVLDEPDNGLDSARLDALVGLVKAHAAAGGATLLASHDAGWLEALGARRFAIGQAP